MKKVFFLMLTLLIGVSVSMNAQVRIGGLDDPNTSAVLDLNANNDAAPTANKGGLSLPRIPLTSATAPLNGAVPPNGTVVYNTNAGMTGGAGVYFWNGSQWVLAAGTAPVIISQPESFSWSRLYEKDGDPNSTVTEFSPVLTVVASGSGLSYKWYKKALNKNAADTKVAESQSYTPVVTAWGMNSYYCVVSNAYGNVKSDVVDVAAGCGAKTVDGGWLKFMCHNVGASPVGTDQSLDEITFDTNSTIDGGDTISIDAKGWLFQWGRVADGYQWRSSETIAGPVTLSNVNQVPQGNTAYGKFIANNIIAPYDWRDPQRDVLWRNWNDGRFPCPSGWRIPSSSEWGSIYRSGGSYGTPGSATANTWNWTTGKGCQIKPDGSTTTLFLPAAGSRGTDGTLGLVGTYGDYWSSTSGSSGVLSLAFNSSRVSPGPLNDRVRGFSVRCLAEE